MKRSFLILSLGILALPSQAQESEVGKIQLGKGLGYRVEIQGSVSNTRTPLWLNANHYGLSSLEKNNGYVRVGVERPLVIDSLRRWGLGYGLDVAGAYQYTSKPIVQQAYVEARWLKGVLTIGSKQLPMEMKNNRLSSGSQTLGINARPVPQFRLALDQWWKVFGVNWLALKGHVAYGMLTDEGWEKDFTHQKSKYSEGVFYHSKSGYLRIGNPYSFMPFSAELGLEMASLFGGNSYIMRNGQLTKVKNSKSVKSFLKALIPGGNDVPEKGSVYLNEEGDVLGSWVGRINYNAETWRLSFYFDKFFEDHSSMLQMDYDGYGEGEEWNVKKKRRFFVYDFKDWLLGGEFNLKYGTWLRDIVFEYIYSKYQSGPIYHDHSPGRVDHISGRDNFYNHYIYSGWQHWGQVMGNPLYRSPIYNNDGQISVEDNRFVAFHLGFQGRPAEYLDYRILATYQEGFGTYENPYDKKHHNLSFMVEAGYSFPHNWKVTGAYGMDFGHILGHNAGVQITIVKSGILDL